MHAAMDAMAQEHEHLRKLIAETDGDAIETFFARCRAVRRQHDDILNPLTPGSEQTD